MAATLICIVSAANSYALAGQIPRPRGQVRSRSRWIHPLTATDRRRKRRFDDLGGFELEANARRYLLDDAALPATSWSYRRLILATTSADASGRPPQPARQNAGMPAAAPCPPRFPPKRLPTALIAGESQLPADLDDTAHRAGVGAQGCRARLSTNQAQVATVEGWLRLATAGARPLTPTSPIPALHDWVAAPQQPSRRADVRR